MIDPRLLLNISASDWAQATVNKDSADNTPAAFFAGVVPWCVGTSQAATQECRTRGGTATLCGFDTFIPKNPGPQVRFRKKEIQGEIFWCYYDLPTPTCLTPVASFGLRYGDGAGNVGNCTYNAATCAVTNAMFVNVHNGSAACVPAAYDPPIANACTSQTPDCTLSIGTNLLSRIITGNNLCCNVNLSTSRKASGVITETLTLEDNDPEAIVRLLAATPWTAFGAAAQCQAEYEQRANFADYDFAYQEAEYRITGSGLTPSRLVCVELDVYRRLYGVGAYVLFATLQLGVNTDGAGAFTVTGVVPNLIGYQTYTANPRVFPPPF